MSWHSRSLHHRLVAYVSVGLLLATLMAGAVIFRVSFSMGLSDAVKLEAQLVRTVQAQAEVAAFATNVDIAEGVIDSLRSHPNIMAVRIESADGGAVASSPGFHAATAQLPVTAYPLYTPIDGRQVVGRILVGRNAQLIRDEATLGALVQCAILVAEILITAILIVLFSRHLITRPLAQLARSLADIAPGGGARLEIPPTHQRDEIGSLARSANGLLASAELAMRELEAQALTDALTNLPNRRAFIARLEHDLARIKRYEGQSISLLMCDLDHFKQVNDSHGHGTGDAVLKRFGQLLAEELRRVDAAGRIGGEEFAVVLEATPEAAAMNFAERLRLKCEQERIEYEGRTLCFTISIGVTALSESDSGAMSALNRADQALYQAKAAGRNRVALFGAESLQP